GHRDAAEGAQDRRPAVRDGSAAELWRRLCRPLQCNLSGACEIIWGAALPVFPRRRCIRRKAQPARWDPSDRGGRGRHREEYSAHGGGISWHYLRATQLKKRQYPGGLISVNATCFAESQKSGRK